MLPPYFTIVSTSLTRHNLNCHNCYKIRTLSGIKCLHSRPSYPCCPGTEGSCSKCKHYYLLISCIIPHGACIIHMVHTLFIWCIDYYVEIVNQMNSVQLNYFYHTKLSMALICTLSLTYRFPLQDNRHYKGDMLHLEL